MSSTPAAAPPAGVVANFTDPETSHRELGIALTSVGMALMSTIMILRVYTKTVLISLFGIDDIIAVLAWAISLSTQSLYMYLWASRYLGTHIWDFTAEDLNEFNRILTVASVTAALTTSLAKAALLLSYRKMWLVKWFKVITFLVLTFLFCYTTAIFLTLIFACAPLAKNWDITITTGHCINKNAIYVASGMFSATTDVITFILPMPMVCGLQLRPCQKAGIILMFAIASLTLVVSMVFLCLIFPIVLKGSADMPWDLSRICVLVTVQANLVLICGCFPALKLWARRTVPRCFSTSERGAIAADVPWGEALPPSWESELSTITTGVSSGGTRKDSARSAAAKILDFDQGRSMVRQNIESAVRKNGVVIGQVLPDPDP